jgi:hypothetical protein
LASAATDCSAAIPNVSIGLACTTAGVAAIAVDLA